jgi:alkanesulfonate monooxygenase SsuD/methylene tetrahydromethanopterin reductase-like flavin-dependent oxidoreductase (luciferase family)
MEIFVYTPLVQSPESASRAAREIEEFGYDGIALPDHLFVPSFSGGTFQAYAHAVTVLAACAAATSRLRLLTLVSNVLARGPVELAHSVSTLQRLSSGRVELGLGAGWFRDEFDAAGLPFPSPSERIGRLEETVAICRALFAGGDVYFAGRHFNVALPAGTFLACSPPPILVGGAAPRSVRAAAELGDRVDLQPNALAGGGLDLTAYNSYTSDALAAQIALVREVEDSTGRRIPVSESPFVAVEPDAKRAKQRRREMAASNGMETDLMDRSLGTIVGTAEEVAERLSVYAGAGCDRLHLQALDATVPARLAPLLPQLQRL